jgi:hypothetical protein
MKFPKGSCVLFRRYKLVDLFDLISLEIVLSPFFMDETLVNKDQPNRNCLPSKEQLLKYNKERDGELTELEMVVDPRGTEGLVLDGERERRVSRERKRKIRKEGNARTRARVFTSNGLGLF